MISNLTYDYVYAISEKYLEDVNIDTDSMRFCLQLGLPATKKEHTDRPLYVALIYSRVGLQASENKKYLQETNIVPLKLH